MSTISITIGTAPQAPSPITPPEGDYYYQMGDWETDEYGGGVRPSVIQNGGEPATMKSRHDIWVPMPEPFQRWYYEVFKLHAPTWMTEAEKKQAWANIWASKLAWTNFQHGSEYLADYINGTNLDKEPMARETLGSRRNVLLLRKDLMDGSIWLPFDAITATSHLHIAPYDFARMFWLNHLCTIQTSNKLPDGTYQIDRFPQFKHPVTRETTDVPMPLLGEDDGKGGGVIWFKREFVRKIPALPRWNPYNPPKPFNPSF